MNIANILILAVAIGATTAHGQLTLTPERNPLPGDRVPQIVLDTTGVSPGNPGANQTWDFSAVAATGDSFIVRYVHPAQTPGAAAFPNATVATEYIGSGDSSYTYYVGASSHFALLGMTTTDMTVVYANAQVLMTYPFGYGSEFGDVYSASFAIDDDMHVVRHGSVQGRGDAHGTIVLPGGATHQVLRVKLEQVQVDTTYVAEFPLFVTSAAITSYQWYTADAKFPVIGITETRTTVGSNMHHTKTVTLGTSTGTVNVDEPSAIPERVSLEQNYPNPFNPATTIRFTLVQQEEVTLEVYNLIGQKVATLVENESLTPGMHEIAFGGAGLPSGVYLYTLKTGSGSLTRKLTLMK